MVGVITTAAVTAACAAVVETFSHQLIEITQYGYPLYLSIQKFRYEYTQNRYTTHSTVYNVKYKYCTGGRLV